MERSLREALQQWCDCELAAYALAVCLGLMPEGIFQTHGKHVFWSKNEMGNLLYRVLDQLVAVSVLETRDEPDKQYRWNPAFRGGWEAAV